MKTLQQHIEEKLIINKDFKKTYTIGPDDLNVGDNLLGFFTNGKAFDIDIIKITEIEKETWSGQQDKYNIKFTSASDYNNVTNDMTMFWNNDLHCFIYVIRIYDILHIFVTFDYIEYFKSFVNDISIDNTYYGLDILNRLGLDSKKIENDYLININTPQKFNLSNFRLKNVKKAFNEL